MEYQNSDIEKSEYFKYTNYTSLETLNNNLKELTLLLKDLNSNENKAKEISKVMKYIVHPDRCYNRLGQDKIQLLVGKNLLNYVDATKTPGDLLPKLTWLRKELTDKYGYIVCNIRIMDDARLEPNEYKINIRGKEVFKSHIDFANTEENEITTIIVKDIENICLKYVAQIFTQTETLKIIELVNAQDPLLISDLIPIHISTYDLTRIFIKLLQQKVSIKDVIYIFELLNFHAQHTQDIEKLTELLIKDLNFVL